MRPYNNDFRTVSEKQSHVSENFTRFIHRGWLYVPKASYEEFCDFLHNIVLLPLSRSIPAGESVFSKLTEEEFASKEDPKEFYQKLCEGRYLAEEFVQSCKELAAFHPSSLNTLRVITFRNGDRFEVFGGGLRVGNNGLCVDNAHGGGIFCEIDPESGKIITDGLDEYSNSYVTHPMTGVPFKGMQIPRWKEVVELCKEASKELPCLRVVGWDVAILEDGTLELIEGNHSPGMNIVQAPAKHGVYERFSSMLLDYYGEPDQYVTKQSA